MKNKHIGSSLRSLFVDLGEEEAFDLLTRKKVLADEVAASMAEKHISKEALAAAMRTSRTVVYRLLDPTDTGVTLETLSKASTALGLDLHISFAPRTDVVRARRKAPVPKKRGAARAVRATRSEARSPARG